MSFFPTCNMLEQPQTGPISRFFRQAKNRLKNCVKRNCTIINHNTWGIPSFNFSGVARGVTGITEATPILMILFNKFGKINWVKNMVSTAGYTNLEILTTSLIIIWLTVGTVLSARVVINFEKFLEGILFVNLVRFLFKN